MDPKRQGSAAIAKSLYDIFIHIFTDVCAFDVVIFVMICCICFYIEMILSILFARVTFPGSGWIRITGIPFRSAWRAV